MRALLLKEGADINMADAKGKTALYWAVNLLRLHIVKELIEKGADINKADIEGNTPLMRIAKTNYVHHMEPDDPDDRPDIMKFLIDNGAKINAKNNKGETALMHAIISYHPYLPTKYVEILVENGADINIKDNKGHTAFPHAVMVDRTDAIEYLKKTPPIRPLTKKLSIRVSYVPRKMKTSMVLSP